MTSQSDENSVQLPEYHHMMIMNRVVIEILQSSTGCLAECLCRRERRGNLTVQREKDDDLAKKDGLF